ncbi:hypothetical protein [Yersinia ruckeri]|uniref:hypothetical protein n=1 Tax=Yersinia ruckeri TaxID=29486 RepID=UPI002238738A|nr:hypothetical protein [Yersinia ruckeri]MCW6598691.1 hypothetical protein [Yersinia ruckeri]
MTAIKPKVIIVGLRAQALAELKESLKNIVEVLDYIPGESLHTVKIKEMLKEQSIDINDFLQFAADDISLLSPFTTDQYFSDHLYRRLEHFLKRQKALHVTMIRGDQDLFQKPLSFIRTHQNKQPKPEPEEPEDPNTGGEGGNENTGGENTGGEGTETQPPVDGEGSGSDNQQPPEEDPEPAKDPEPEAPTYVVPTDAAFSYNAKTSFTNSGGNLIYGSGQPSGGLAIATDGILEVGLGARTFGSKVLVDGAEGKYALLLGEAEDWAVPVTVGLQNTADGTVVTDLYDLDLTIDGYTYKLAKSDASYIWEAPEAEHNVTDVANKNNAIQTIIRQFQEPVEGAEFQASLHVTHKASGKSFDLSITATVSKAAPASE